MAVLSEAAGLTDRLEAVLDPQLAWSDARRLEEVRRALRVYRDALNHYATAVGPFVPDDGA
jgi:type II secretory pathway pseudopilin PulG